jgi:hypothetical protein
LHKIESGFFGEYFIQTLINNDKGEITIKNWSFTGTDGTTVYVNMNEKFDDTVTEDGFMSTPFFIVLGHELGHANLNIHGYGSVAIWFTDKIAGHDVKVTEVYASMVENLLRMDHNMPLRTHYAYMYEKGTTKKIADPVSLLFTETTEVNPLSKELIRYITPVIIIR